MKGAIFIWRFGGEGRGSCGRPKPEIKVRSECILIVSIKDVFVGNLWPFVHIFSDISIMKRAMSLSFDVFKF